MTAAPRLVHQRTNVERRTRRCGRQRVCDTVTQSPSWRLRQQTRSSSCRATFIIPGTFRLDDLIERGHAVYIPRDICPDSHLKVAPQTIDMCTYMSRRLVLSYDSDEKVACGTKCGIPCARSDEKVTCSATGCWVLSLSVVSKSCVCDLCFPTPAPPRRQPTLPGPSSRVYSIEQRTRGGLP